MADLFNQQISATYSGLLKTSSSGVLSASLSQISDGRGNTSPLYLSTDSIQFYGAYAFPNSDGSDGQVLKTDGAGVLTWENDSLSNTLDFSGGTGTGSVTLDSQVLAFTGTANQIETSASSQAITLSFPTAGVTLPDGSIATTQASTDSSTLIATTAYVKSVVTAEDLDTIGDSGTGSIDLDSQSLSVLGTTNEITTVAANQSITLSFPTAGVTLPNGSVATTQTASDDSTKVATTEYVTDAIGSISFDVTKTGTITENQIAVWNDSTDELRSDETLTIGTDHSITLLQKNSVDADLNSININGGNVAATTGTRNTGFGYENLNAITSGSNNTAIGYGTLKALAFGGSNTAIGMNALNKATGSNNVAIGVNAGQDVLANGSNTVIGYQSYEFGTSQSSVAIGYQSLRGASATNIGQGNTAIGYQSLSGITNGFQNIAIGYQSGLAMSSGDKNVIIGSFSGQEGSFDIRASDNNIILSDGDGNIRQWMDANGKLQLPDYGSGTHTGTLAKSLGVDTSGNVIEFTSGAGTGTVAGTGTEGTITKWATGGADIDDSVIVESGSVVGIGVTPSAQNGGALAGSVETDGILRVRGADGSNFTTGDGLELSKTYIYSYDRDNSNYNTLSINDTITVEGAGNVGIGENNPTYKLEVKGAGTNTLQKWQTTEGGALLLIPATNAANPDWTFTTGTSENIQLDPANNDSGLMVKYNGNVGIGNTNPSVPLDITSNSGAVALKIRARTQNDYGFMSFYNNAGTAYWGEIYYNGSSTAGSSLNFTVGSGIPKLTITSGGAATFSKNVIIEGKDNEWALNCRGGTTNNQSYGLLIKAGTTADYSLSVQSLNGTERISVRGDGYLYSASAWSGSDRRLKENIIDLDNGLSKILALQPRKFDFIDGFKNEFGFIAQEVQPIIPEAVSVYQEENEMLAIKMDFIIPHLTKAIQEQQTIIEDLKSRIETLEG